MAGFTVDQLRAIEAADEVRIETRGSVVGPSHRTIIWVVVDAGEVFVRSVRGDRGRWYRELLERPDGILHVGREAIPVVAERVAAPVDIERCSAALRTKYANDPALGLMLKEDVLVATLRLRPAAAG